MRRFLHTACALLIGIGSAYAQPQTESLSGNAEQIWHGSAAGANAGKWLDLGAVGSGDSRSDLIIGAPGNSVTSGTVYVIFGGPSRSGDLSLDNADTIITGGAANDQFGAATAAGNVITPETSQTRNLIVAAPNAFGGKGAVYVFLGGFTVHTHLSAADANFTIVGRAGDQLGSALATADLDNDGYREIIIGAPGNDRFYVIKGGASLTGTRDLSVTSPDIEVAGLGIGDVLAAADVTGDGISDLVVGAAEMDSNRGMVYVYKGRASGGLPSLPDMAFGGVSAGDRAGASLRLLDIDHDGVKDLIIGAPGVDGPSGGRTDSGAVYMFWGGPALKTPDNNCGVWCADVSFYGATAGMQLGTHVSAGDINRDTPSDIVMLAPGTGGSAGELDIYYGRSVRTTYGSDRGDGRRIVDFADATQIDRRIVGDPSLGALSFTQVFEVTGEGARDIVAGVASQDSSAGAVYFTISPSLSVDSTSISMALSHDMTGTSAAAVTIANRSILNTTWKTTSTAAWLSGSPSTGSSSSAAPGTVKAAVNTAGMAPGSYTGTLNIVSTSSHLDMTIPITVTLTVTDTRISIDSPASGTTITEPATISGWAIDRGAASGTGVDGVQLYAVPTSNLNATPVSAGTATYGAARSDIGALYGSQFTNSGFSGTISGLTPGTWHVMAYAHQVATNTLAASVAVDVTIQALPGELAIDAPSEGQTVTSAFEVGGWALDPAAASGTGVDSVQFWAFPNNGADPGVFLGTGSYGWSRADVAAKYGARFENCGYHMTVTGMTPGKFLIGVYARSTVTGSYSLIKTVHVTVDANVLMSIDVPAPEAQFPLQQFAVGGWAIDRTAPTGVGVDLVHVYAYPNPGSNQPPIFIGQATLGYQRDDVAAFYGSRYVNSGYLLVVNPASVGLAPGVYNIAIWCRSSATGNFNNVAVVRIRLQ